MLVSSVQSTDWPETYIYSRENEVKYITKCVTDFTARNTENVLL